MGKTVAGLQFEINQLRKRIAELEEQIRQFEEQEILDWEIEREMTERFE